MTNRPEYSAIEDYANAHRLNSQELSKVLIKSFRSYYSAAISIRVKHAMQLRVQEGQWSGRAPIGYRNVNKDIVQDPQLAYAVRTIFESFLERMSCEEIIQRLYDEGVDLINQTTGKKFNKAIIDKILRNPFYHGVMVYNGRCYPHRYEPIITKYMFDEAQHLLDIEYGY